MAPGRDEMIDERRDVAAPVAQRRQRHRDHVEAVEEILAEPAIGNQAAHVAVGRGDDAHIGLERLATADGRIFVGLEDARQPRLRLQRHVAYLVEEKRPARRSEEHTSELQSLMRNSYAVFCLKKKKT